MTTFLLIRHGLTDAVKKTLTGRTPGVSLNAAGRAQAEKLAERLAELPLTAIYSSPLERTMQMAEPIALPHILPVTPLPEFAELDFGKWTGRDIEGLESVPQWKLYNSFRSGTRIPGGELMLEVQARSISKLAELHHTHPNDAVAIVTHGDIIRAVIGYYLGSPLDFILRLEISPGSLSIVELQSWGPRVMKVNEET